MSNAGKLRIGIDGARELEIEVKDVDGAVEALEEGLAAGTPIVWLTDQHDGRHGIASARVAFVEVELASNRAVGFG
jgi:hypothetical protein